ncbi:cysteine proteinase [Thozetella sp. PMI_491]|nr:cysteine proteinase [Thozetella sp. PMI_491]
MDTWGDALPPTAPGPGPRKKDYNKTPQELVGEFWAKFFSKKPGKVTSIFPRSLYATLLPPSHARGFSSARNAAESYEAAAKECREKVKRIVRECNRTNEKFTDPDFDIESDPDNNCLNGLVRSEPEDAGSGMPVTAGQLHGALDTLVSSQVLGPQASVPINVAEIRNFIGSSNPWASLLGADNDPGAVKSSGSNATTRNAMRQTRNGKPDVKTHARRYDVKAGESYMPGTVHRLDWIFESPQFTLDGYSSSDIKQGSVGDCWWLAAVATIAHRKELIDKVCVARDEECGVYGFVFQRDGEWIHTVIDDNLYLTYEDFDYYGDTYDATGKRAREHRKQNQTGSGALFFSKCADPNETWLPLLEKAYAKVHGDYEAISGGSSGEAVEDMTGGVTTMMETNRVLRKDRLWKELVNSDGEFVFSLSAVGTGWDTQKSGLALGHAYSILQATEEVDEDGKKIRLVKIRNPWGERAYNGIGEWNGPWSDGSKEWTPYWLKKLNHTFGDDGVFWMSFQDMLETFLFLHRTRLFDEKWTVIQQWTSVNVAWVSGYLNTKFLIEVKKAGMVVIVLSQLDDRYFQGFEGQYQFSLHFLLQEENGAPGEHICRVRPVHDWGTRSVSCEIDLEPGRYEVVPKITAVRDAEARVVEDVVREHAEKNPQKLRQVGMQYDLAHAKGGLPDEDDLIAKKKEEEKKKEEDKKRRRKEARKRSKVRIELSAGEDAKVTIEAETGEKEEKAEGKQVTSPKGSEEETKEEEKFEDAVEEKAKTEESVKDEKKVEEKAEKEDGSGKKSEPETQGQQKGDAPAATSAADPKSSGDGEKPAGAQAAGKDGGEGAEKEEEGVDDDDDDDDDDDEDMGAERDESPVEEDDSMPPPWNAVCVVGLRVYAKDAQVSINLVKPKDAEEAASLAVDGQPAGATA